jgi:hypothetical protein
MADWAEKAVREILGRSDYAVTNIAPINDADLIQSLATALREARVAALEEADNRIGEFAKACVGNTLPDGARNPYLYEQGIGAERCQHIIRSLKTTPAEEPTK